MATDQEVIVSLNLLYHSNLAAGMKADQLVIQETQARLQTLGISSTRATTEAAASTEASSARSVKSLGTWSTYMGLAGAAAGLYAVHMASGMSEAEAHVRAFTTTSPAELKKVEDAAYQLSLQTGISAQNIMVAYYNIASSIQDPVKAMAILQNSMRFSIASQTDAATATRILVDITNAYHLSAAQIPKVQDDIAASIKYGAAEARDFVPALEGLIPTASHAGVSIKQLGGFLAEMTNNIGSASEAGVYLQNLINQLLAPTRSQILAVEALGGKYDDLRIKNGNVLPTLQRLNELMKGSAPTIQDIADRTHLTGTRLQVMADQMSNADGRARQLFGGNFEAAKGFFTLMAQGGSQTSAMLQQMARDAGTNQDSFKKAMDSSQADFRKTTAAIDYMAAQIGKTLLPQVRDFAIEGGKVAKTIGDISNVSPGATKAVFDLALAFTALGLGVRGTVALGGVWKDAYTAAAAPIRALAAIIGGPELGLGAVSLVTGGILVKTAHDTHDAWAQTYPTIQSVSRAYLDNKISVDQLRASWEKLYGPDVSHVFLDNQIKQIEYLRVQGAAVKALGDAYNYLFGAQNAVTLQFAYGPVSPTPERTTGGGAPVTPQLVDLQKALADATTKVQKLADQVYTDTQAFGKHSPQVEADQKALDAAIARRDALTKSENDLTQTHIKTTAALSLHSAKLDALTRATEAQQKAANAITADIEAGRPITDAQRKAYADATAEVNRMQKALSDIVAPAVALKNALPNVSLAVSELNFFATAVHGAVDPLNLLAAAAYKASQYMLPGPYGRPGDIGTNPELQHPSPPIRPYGEDVTGTLGPGGGRPAFGPGATGAYSFTTGFPNAQITLTAPATVNMDRSTLLAGGGAGLTVAGTPGGGTNVGGMGILEPTAPLAPGTPIDRNALVAAFGPLVSQFQSAMSSSNAVNAAHLQVLQQEGAQQVQLLSTQVTLTQDLTGEISALSSLQQAQGQGAITAINDQTTIFQAISAGQVQAIKDSQTIQADIASGNTAKLAQDSQIASIDQALARDQIGIAQEQAAIDRSASQTAILLAGDNLKAAQDKTLVDAANAQAQAKLMGAQLLVAQDQERLTIDGNKLSYDMLQTLVSIDQSLPGQKDFGSMLHDDMAAMSRDNAALLSDQGLVGQLTNAANILAQNGQQQLAYDAQQTAIDAANGASQKLGLELTLAGLKQQEARDQSMLNVLQASYQVQSQLLASTQATNTALIDYVRTLQDENRNLRDPGVHQITVLPGLPGSNHPVGMRALLSR